MHKIWLRLFVFSWIGDWNKKKHEKFAFVLKVVLTLSHGQVPVEWNFSFDKSYLRANITEESIIPKNTVRNHLQANKVILSMLKVPCKLVVSCNSAYGRYKASLQEKAKEAEKTVAKVRRELFQEETSLIFNLLFVIIFWCF